MDNSTERFRSAVERFDAANSLDPKSTDGVPDALLYARRMTERLSGFAPNAPEAVRLAARCQHIRRWEIPRGTYPMTRAGYHQWRTRLGAFHAEVAGEILRGVGYDEATVLRVQSLLRKERLKQDPDTQLLEDVVCLVFLEHYFADFAAEHEEEKLLTILRRTWGKMSERGREAALGLALPEESRALVAKALSGPRPPGGEATGGPEGP